MGVASVAFFSAAVLGLVLLSQYGARAKGIDINSLLAPGGNTTSTVASDSSPSRLALNTTALSDKCSGSCQGGLCNQTVVGTTTCLTCPAGYTLQDPPSQCLDLRVCYTYPWCSTVDAVVLSRLHTGIVNVSLDYITRTNRTLLPLDGSLTQSPHWDDLRVLYNRLQHNGANATLRAIDVADLANAWIAGRIQMGSDRRSVAMYFDDEAGYWSRYAFYQPPPAYVVYAATLKSRVCGNNWRPSNATDCVRPSAIAVHACGTLTPSQLQQNAGVCV